MQKPRRGDRGGFDLAPGNPAETGVAMGVLSELRERELVQVRREFWAVAGDRGEAEPRAELVLSPPEEDEVGRRDKVPRLRGADADLPRGPDLAQDVPRATQEFCPRVLPAGGWPDVHLEVWAANEADRSAIDGALGRFKTPTPVSPPVAGR